MKQNQKKAKKRPECDRLGCFACDAGECIALDKAFPQKCPFYKTRPDYRRGVRKSFYRLIARNRLDLILRYWGEPADFGPYIKEVRLPEEIEFDAGKYREKLAGNGLPGCPACNQEECFAAVNGRCIVLNTETAECTFYQKASSWYSGIMKSFCQIVARERFDLVLKYRDTLREFGFFSSSIKKAWARQEELARYRQETFEIMRHADDLETCKKALMPEETDFLPLYKQPNKSRKKRRGEPEAGNQSSGRTPMQETGGGAGVESTDGEEEPDTIITEADRITTIPDDESQADSQMKEITELLDESGADAIAAEKAITLVNRINGADPESGAEETRLHEENRFVKGNAGRIFRIEDFYRPGLLRSQAVKRRSYDDWIIGDLADEILLLAARDYVKALREQLLYPQNIEKTIHVVYYENYFGSRDYWQLTNLNPEKVKQRCVEIAMCQEKAAILNDNEKIIVSQNSTGQKTTE